MDKREEEAGRWWMIDMYGERGRLSPALCEGGNGDSGVMAGGRRDTEHTEHGPGIARRYSAT